MGFCNFQVISQSKQSSIGQPGLAKCSKLYRKCPLLQLLSEGIAPQHQGDQFGLISPNGLIN
jgi:hypothetical protein